MDEDCDGIDVGSSIFIKITHAGSLYGRSKLCMFGLDTMFTTETDPGMFECSFSWHSIDWGSKVTKISDSKKNAIKIKVEFEKICKNIECGIKFPKKVYDKN